MRNLKLLWVALAMSIGVSAGAQSTLTGDYTAAGWKEKLPSSAAAQKRYSIVDLAYMLKPAKVTRFRVTVDPSLQDSEIALVSGGTRLDALRASLDAASLTGNFNGETLSINRRMSQPQVVAPAVPQQPPAVAAPQPQMAVQAVAQAPMPMAVAPNGQFMQAPMQVPMQAQMPVMVAQPQQFAPQMPMQPPQQVFAGAMQVPQTNLLSPQGQNYGRMQNISGFWEIDASDVTLANVFAKWAKMSGYRVKWDAGKHVLVGAPDSIQGTFEEAVEKVLSAPGVSRSDYPLEVCFYPNRPPLARITRRGEQERECR